MKSIAMLLGLLTLGQANDGQLAIHLAPQRVRVARMATGQPIASIQVAQEGLLKVLPIPSDPTRVILQGLKAGQTTVAAKDKDGKEETWQVTVGPSVLVFVGETEVVGTKSGKPAAKFVIDGDKIARLERGVASKAAVRIVGLAPGNARLLVTDDAGQTDSFYLQVRALKEADKATLQLPAGGKLTFQMASKKSIILLLNEADDIISISTTGSPRAVVLEARKHGISKLFVMDEDGGVEEYEVLSRSDAR